MDAILTFADKLNLNAVTVDDMEEVAVKDTPINAVGIFPSEVVA